MEKYLRIVQTFIRYDLYSEYCFKFRCCNNLLTEKTDDELGTIKNISGIDCICTNEYGFKCYSPLTNVMTLESDLDLSIRGFEKYFTGLEYRYRTNNPKILKE